MRRGFIITAIALVEMALALILLNGGWLVLAFTAGAAACIAFPPKV